MSTAFVPSQNQYGTTLASNAATDPASQIRGSTCSIGT